jgi:hypothetical protein
MATLTGANIQIFFSIAGLYNAPVQLQGFMVDDVYDTDQIASTETMMGVDGILSAGFVFVPVKQNFALQADSASIAIFENWWATNQQLRDSLSANASILLPSLGKKYTQTKGFLTGYKPMPDIKKLAQGQKFAVTWQQIAPAPTGS